MIKIGNNLMENFLVIKNQVWEKYIFLMVPPLLANLNKIRLVIKEFTLIKMVIKLKANGLIIFLLYTDIYNIKLLELFIEYMGQCSNKPQKK